MDKLGNKGTGSYDIPTIIQAALVEMRNELATKINEIIDNSLTTNELAAIRGANSPSGTNVFATTDDIPT